MALISERVDLSRSPFKDAQVVATKGAGANAVFVAGENSITAIDANSAQKSESEVNPNWYEEEYASITIRSEPERKQEQVDNTKALSNKLRSQVVEPYLGFTDRIALTQLPNRGNLRLLASLWNSHGHLLVSRKVADRLRAAYPPSEKFSLKHLAELREKDGPNHLEPLKVYVGSNGSTTDLAGRALFTAAGLPTEDFVPHRVETTEANRQPTDRNRVEDSSSRDPKSHGEAARALIEDPELNPIDAAVIVAGLPSDAVKFALNGGCMLLDINRGELDSALNDLKTSEIIKSLDWSEPKARSNSKARLPISIPTDAYDIEPVTTFTTRGLLVANQALDDTIANQMVKALFTPRQGRTGQEILLRHHAAAEEISLETSLEDWRKRKEYNVEYHPGAEEFWKHESEGSSNVVWLYSGPMGGTSYRLGAEMAEILTNTLEGVEARVVNTQGSSDSIARMHGDDQRRSLALVHNDAATQAFSLSGGDAKSLRLLSFLYPETVHLLTVERTVPNGSADANHCACPPIEGLSDRPSLREIVPALAKRLHQFGVSDDEFSFTRDQELIRYYGSLAGHSIEPKPGTADASDTNRVPVSPGLKQLSPVKLQERLIEGSLLAALVTSGTPMPLVNQLLTPDHPRLARSLKLAKLAEKDAPPCARCNLPKSVGDLSFRVLPLDTTDPNRPAGSPVPNSVRGLTTRNHLLKPTIIPPHTYMRSQLEEAQTVSVELVLICRDDLELEPSEILGSLFDNEVRLRNIVAETKLRDPLGGNAKDPSIPLHAEARSFYEKKGLLAPLPQPDTYLSKEIVLPALSSALFLLLGIIAPTNWKHEIQRILFGWVFRQEKRRNGIERRLRAIYFKDQVPPQAKAEQVESIMDEIYQACEKRELSHGQAESLDLLARDYLERLHSTYSWWDHPSDEAPGHERNKPPTRQVREAQAEPTSP